MEKKKHGYIYKTTNLVNGKIYIGQRKYGGNEVSYLGSGVLIKKAIEKYGRENFKKEIIIEVESQEEANELEIYYIKVFNSQDPKIGYNIAFGGNCGPIDERTRKKMSENNSLKGKTLPKETCLKISKTLKGKKLPKESYLKTGAFCKRLKWIHKKDQAKRILPEKIEEYFIQGWSLGYPEKSKKKMSETAKRNGKSYIHGRKGWHHTKEDIRKISEASKRMWEKRKKKNEDNHIRR